MIAIDDLPEVNTFGVTEVTVTGLTNMKLSTVLSKSTPFADISTETIEPAKNSGVVKTTVFGDDKEAVKVFFSRRHRIVPDEGIADELDMDTIMPPEEGPMDRTIVSTRNVPKYRKSLPEELKSKWLVVTSTTMGPGLERGDWHSIDFDETYVAGVS